MEQRSLRTAALLLLLTAAAPAQQDGDEFTRLLAEGGGHFDAGRYQEALGTFARARLVSPGDWRGHTWQALTLLRLAEGERDPGDDSDRVPGLVHLWQTGPAGD